MGMWEDADAMVVVAPMASNGHGYCDGHNAMDDVVQNGMMMK